MYCRVTTCKFEDDRFDEILAWGETVRASIEGVDGFQHADVFRSAPGEGIIVAVYEDEYAFVTAAGAVSSVFGEMGQFLISPPQTHSGTVDLSFGR